MDLTRNNWSRGWTPSDDAVNGRPDGLLRMDNLCLDENGVLSLARGIQQVNQTQFEGYVHSIYSRYFDNTKVRYVGLHTGRVLKSSTNFTTSTEVLSNGDPDKARFASAYGHVLVCSASQKKKDNNVNIYNLGITKPITAPTVIENPQPELYIDRVAGLPDYSNWTLEEGTNLGNTGDHLEADSDATTFRVIWKRVFAEEGHDRLDTTAYSPQTEWNQNDRFLMSVRIPDTNALERVRIEFHLDDDLTNPTNYFYFEWNNDSLDEPCPYNPGLNVWSILETTRRDFGRAGDDPNKGWNNIKAIRVIHVYNTAVVDAYTNEMHFIGGKLGSLVGNYDYVQVNIYNSGAYIGKSAIGPIAYQNHVKNGTFNVTPIAPTDSQVNEIWIYRRSSEVKDVIPVNEVPQLDKFYLVKQLQYPAEFAAFDDELTDEEALQLNIFANEFLISVGDLTDDLLMLVSNYYERVLYMTFKEIYLSDRLNPDAVDSRYTIKLSGNSVEKNLWIAKVDVGTVLVGTTHDIYALSGTLLDLPDGTLDCQIRPLGLDKPPISEYFTCIDGTVYYMANDGWHAVTASGESIPIIANIDLLFKGHSRHGLAPTLIIPNAGAAYPIAISGNCVWTSQPCTDGTRACYVYDVIRQYWRPYYTDPISLFAEEDGTLLGGYGGGSGNWLQVLDTGYTEGGNGQNIHLLTISDHNGQPRNRKDVFTFKITADTGNTAVDIQISKDGTSFISLGQIAFNGKEEKLISIINLIGLGFRYAVRILGSVTTFKLYNFTIEYEPRPEQLTDFRIPYSNLGSYARKRITNYAFVIDTLGNNVSFTPLLDGTNLSGSTVNLDRKGTHIHYFTSETIGTDIGGLLSGGPFEFYGLNLEEIISEKLPTPVKYLVIPANDYGQPNRKRHSSYKFAIHTRGSNVRFTPRLDGIDKTPSIANTTEKRVHEHFFTSDTISIDIGGVLESTDDTPFEFYGVIVPQHIEVLPPRLKEFRIPENNYGIAAKKRIRTMPMEINTNGYPVTFTPIVDGVSLTSSILTTSTRATAFHYFTTDVFGTDFSGELVGSEAFEFYGLLKPESVEVLPVAKKFDQIGPFRFDKLAKALMLRVRAITGETNLPIKILSEIEDTLPNSSSSSGIYSGTIATNPNADDIYELILPKTIKGTIIRIELGPTTQPFHRYDLQLRVALSGMETDNRWIKVA